MIRAIAVLALAAALSAASFAQDRLDRNSQRGSGGRNPSSSSGADMWNNMAKPVYTVNRDSGEFVYNRANAFNDPSYNIYQRYTLDRNAYFEAGKTGNPRTRSAEVRGRSSALSRSGYSASGSRRTAVARHGLPSINRTTGTSRSVKSGSASLGRVSYRASGGRASARPAGSRRR